MKQIVYLALVVFLHGCACQLSSSEEAGKEWVTEYPSGFDGKNREFLKVTESRVNLAIDKLNEVPIAPISPERAQWYTGLSALKQTDGRYYLVRAVHGYLGSGGYEVTYDGSSLFVHHTSLGSCMLYNQSALVVSLRNEPKRVFVGVNVAK